MLTAIFAKTHCISFMMYHEADDYGYEFLKRCGKNPWAMGFAFKKLKAISQRKDRSKYEKWLED